MNERRQQLHHKQCAAVLEVAVARLSRQQRGPKRSIVVLFAVAVCPTVCGFTGP